MQTPYTAPSVTALSSQEHAALMRLIRLAQGDTGQSRRSASFLLSWWNARACGGFDPTDLWAVDESVSRDMLTVLGYIARANHYPDTLGLEPEFKEILRLWRNQEPLAAEGS